MRLLEFENKIRKLITENSNQVKNVIDALKEEFNVLRGEMNPYKEKIEETMNGLSEVKIQLSLTQSVKDVIKKMVIKMISNSMSHASIQITLKSIMQLKRKLTI